MKNYIPTSVCALAVTALLSASGVGPAWSAGTSAANDYPTDERADYVFACMASNGQSRKVLEQCSCSIDVIASIIPYKDYVTAETILSMRQVGGEKGALFRAGPTMKEPVANLRRAQAEGEIRCF
jgi:hypothetical protein